MTKFQRLLKNDPCPTCVRPTLLPPDGKSAHRAVIALAAEAKVAEASDGVRDTKAFDEWRLSKTSKRRKKTEPPSPSDILTWIRGTYLHDLDDEVESVANYSVRALLARREVCPAYHALIDLIGSLPRTKRVRGDAQSVDDRAQSNLTSVREILLRFCTAVGSDCWIAYAYDRIRNGPVFVDCHGLQWPEAARGTVWNQSLTSYAMFSGDEPAAVIPFYVAELPVFDQSTRVPFHKREGTVLKHVIGVRIVWAHSRLVVFLNRRQRIQGSSNKPRSEPHITTLVEDVWRCLDNVDRAAQGPVREESLARASAALSGIELCIRYLVGYLTAGGIDLSLVPPVLRSVNATGVAEKIAQAVQASSQNEERKWLIDAVNTLLNEAHDDEEVLAHVHFSTTDRKHLQFTERPLGYQLPGKTIEKAPRVVLAGEGEDRVVAVSVCAQAAVWGAPVFVEDMSAKQSARWRRKDVVAFEEREGKQEPHPTRSQIAIPIDDTDERAPRSVLNLELRHTTLSDERLRRAEMIAHVFARLRRFLQEGDHSDQREDFRRLFLIKCPVRTATLIARFCRWLREQTKADLVRVISYDHRVRVWRPNGVSASPLLLTRFLNELHNLEEIHRPRHLRPSADMARLAEYAIAHRLIPRRRGETWKVFTGQEDLVFSRDASNDPRFADADDEFRHSLRTYSNTLAVLSFASSRSAFPIGVIQLSWIESNAVTARRLEVLRPFMEAVASLYRLYRHCRPEDSTLLFGVFTETAAWSPPAH